MDEKTTYYLKILSKFLMFGLLLLGLWAVYKTAIFYMPFVIALIIASIAEPLIKVCMKKLKMKRKLASIVSLLLIVSLIVIILTLIISSLITESSKLVGNLNTYITDAYNSGIEMIQDIQSGRIEIPSEVMQIVQNSLGGFLESVKIFLANFFTGVINTVTAIPTWITYGFITILAVIFICFDREYVSEVCHKHIPSKWLQKIKMIFKETCSVAIEYIKAEAKLSSICFILVLIGLLGMQVCGLQVEYPIIMAIFIGFVDLLPLFGAGAVMIPWVCYLALTGNIPLAIGVGILWIVWAIIKNLTEPKMISKQMGMHPLFTLIGMYTGFKIFGVLGLMIGPIVLLVLKNIFKELISKGVFKVIFEQE